MKKKPKKCPRCKGRGYRMLWQWVGYNSYVPVTCEACEGKGTI